MNIKLMRWGAALLFACAVISFFAVLNFGALIPALAGAAMIVRGGFADRIQESKKNTRRAKALTAAGQVVLLTYIVLQFACAVFMIDAAEKPRAYKHKRGYDAVVVLGAGFWGDEISLVMAERLDAAAKMLSVYPDAVAVLTGAQVGHEDTSEAEMMRDYLVTERGVDPERLLLENRARTTIENFDYSKALLDARFGDEPCSVLVITSDFHVFRGERIAYNIGFKADWKAARTLFVLLPSYALRESVAIIFGGFLF